MLYGNTRRYGAQYHRGLGVRRDASCQTAVASFRVRRRALAVARVLTPRLRLSMGRTAMLVCKWSRSAYVNGAGELASVRDDLFAGSSLL
jgi:hypothetical protein